MKKHLISETGNFYKANLHCHSTVSDGKLSPEEIKKVYKENGYSIVAFTDHNLMIPHGDLNDESFLAMTGVEYNVDNDDENIRKGHGYTCHINLIALGEGMETQPFWHRTKYVRPGLCNMEYKDRVKFDAALPDYERKYTAECISEIMTKGREANFFVTYNHPYWSREIYSDYIGFNGMHAVEIMNNSSRVSSGAFEYNDKVFDDMLRAGKNVFCVAADDNHSPKPVGSRGCDMCGAYTVIKAERLDLESVAKSLRSGNFYCSEGPEIKALYCEGGKLVVECSPADEIVFSTPHPCISNAVYDESGEGLTRGEFSLTKTYSYASSFGYVRVTVVGKDGKRAYTNAYRDGELPRD